MKASREGEASADKRYTDEGSTNFAATPGPRGGDPEGRWPANVVLDEQAAALLDEQSGDRKSSGLYDKQIVGSREGPASIPLDGLDGPMYADSGGASRFFYCAKADRSDRGEGNDHPTVKPINLMRWLVRLVAPVDGIVLDPFAGSGSTLQAVVTEKRQCIGAQLARDVEQAPPEPAAIPTTVITIDGSNQFPQAIVDRLIREIRRDNRLAPDAN